MSIHSDWYAPIANIARHTGLQTIRKISPEACDFQSLLLIQPDVEKTDHSKLWISEMDVNTERFLTYPLVLQCTLGQDRSILISATFDESRVHQSQMQRIISQYQNIILQLSTRMDATLDRLDMVSPDDMSELRKWTCDHPGPEVIERCLHHQIIEQAYNYPNDIALSSSWGEELTYKDFLNYSSNLGLYLEELGAGPGMMIPIVFEKSIWAVVAMTSVVLSGAAFVPIDPASPTSRRDLLFDQVNASIILASPEHVRFFKRDTVLGIDRIFLESIPHSRIGSKKLPTSNVSESDTAYILFTSGSTGIPKGVIVSHRAVCSSINAHGKAMGFDRHTRALQFCSYTFDVSIAEIFTTLVFGGTVCVPSTAGRINYLAREIQTLRANWSFLTPSVARSLDPWEVPTLEILVLGGEEVGSSDVSRWNRTGLRIINGYGPTEACIFSVTRDIDDHTPARTIGRAIGCITCIVDPDNYHKLAPIGTVGELVISGPILASGYLKNPKRTAEAFIENPSWAQAFFGPSMVPKAFYKTGDIVRYNHLGEIEYMSRKDLQVKVRGLRIELEDVEHWIQAVDQIKQAVVLFSKTKNSEKRGQFVAIFSLIAPTEAKESDILSLIPPQISELHVSRLQEHLVQHLPAYAIPNYWICVKGIPLSSAGKTNRRLVSEWFENLQKSENLQSVLTTRCGSNGARMPVTRSEQRLRDIWGLVLDLPAEGLDLNKSFLSYGGDSVCFHFP